MPKMKFDKRYISFQDLVFDYIKHNEEGKINNKPAITIDKAKEVIKHAIDDYLLLSGDDRK